MAEYIVQDTTLTAIADAVRAKKGTTEPIALTDFATEIESIQSGGGKSKLALIVDVQSADNPYNIVASDIEGATAIRKNMFYDKKGLRSIELPTTCTSTGYGAFKKCTSLTTASMPNVTKIGASSFYGCTSLPSVYAPNVTSIGYEAFMNCTALSSVDLSNVTSIAYDAFKNCKSLTMVSIPNITLVDKNVFYSCTSLTSVDMYNAGGVGPWAFYGCTALASVSMPNMIRIDEGSFYSCRSLTSVEMPNVTSIGTSAFQACSSLTSVSMPNVKSIGSKGFMSCTSLTSLTIPITCTSIGSYALICGSSTNKCTFTFEGTTPPSIQSNTFSTSYINKIIVPVGCGEAYKTATNWNSLASYIEEASS